MFHSKLRNYFIFSPAIIMFSNTHFGQREYVNCVLFGLILEVKIVCINTKWMCVTVAPLSGLLQMINVASNDKCLCEWFISSKYFIIICCNNFMMWFPYLHTHKHIATIEISPSPQAYFSSSWSHIEISIILIYISKQEVEKSIIPIHLQKTKNIPDDFQC